MTMAYILEIDRACKKKINKACKKNPVLKKAVENKVDEILDEPEHFKPLRHSEKGKRRAHILKSFVLIYKLEGKKVLILDFGHHDEAYRR